MSVNEKMRASAQQYLPMYGTPTTDGDDHVCPQCEDKYAEMWISETEQNTLLLFIHGGTVDDFYNPDLEEKTTHAVREENVWWRKG